MESCSTYEIKAKRILTPSKVYDYTVNPYMGCSHACTYCYARFLKRFLREKRNWGSFIYIKINAIDLLLKEIKKKKKGKVWVSGICDPYQSIEESYRLTRACLEILIKKGWPLVIQTKSPLILRDLDLFKSYENLDVFFTITTADDKIRRIFEPNAPPIEERIEALKRLYNEGIRTHVMIAPILIGAEGLIDRIKGYVHSVLLDRLNYHYADWVFIKYGIGFSKEEEFFRKKGEEIKALCERERINCAIIF